MIKLVIFALTVFAGLNAQGEVKVTESVKTEKIARLENLKSWVKANPKKSQLMALVAGWWCLNYCGFAYDLVINTKIKVGTGFTPYRDHILFHLKNRSIIDIANLYLLKIPNLYFLGRAATERA